MNKLTSALFAAAMFVAAPASASLLTNGGFETGDLTGWSCTTTGPDSCNVGSGFGPGPIEATFDWFGFENGTARGELSQTFATSAGATYDFSFFSSLTFTDVPANILSYSFGAGETVVANTLSYAETAGSFMATGAATTLTFFFETDSGTGGFVIDDVSVALATPAVPLPAGMALMLAGVGALAVARRAKA
jgi:hypothetical protein